MSESYSKPAHGWTCFHCGETFTTFGGARDHFGFDPASDPGCIIKLGSERGLLMALRKSEKDAADAWSALTSESSDFAKAYHSAVARHRDQLITAEEAGFERGVRQARSEAQHESHLAGRLEQAKEDAKECSIHVEQMTYGHLGPGAFVRCRVAMEIRAAIEANAAKLAASAQISTPEQGDGE